jgi:hypothetical protein
MQSSKQVTLKLEGAMNKKAKADFNFNEMVKKVKELF